MDKKLLLAILLTPLSLCADSLVSPTYLIRSQGSDASRKMVGLADKVHLYDEGRYVNLAGTLEYTRSFDQDEIAQCLFGDDLVNCNQILVQGSAITGDDRNAKAWLADYFYLPPDYDSYFCIEPTIQNVMFDLDLFVGLDDIAQGLYLRAHGPITYTRWHLNFSEPCDVVTTGSYNFGYFDHDIMFNNQLLGTFGDYAQGKTPLNTAGFDGATIDQPEIGVAFLPLQYAQIDTCEHSRSGFADLRLELGCDFCQDDDYHFGFNAQVAAPTGNRTRARFAFDPTIGNRNHWEAGAGLSAHYTFWRAQGEDKHAGFYLDLNVTHLNNAKEQRTFDLCGRPNSRYMLAMAMDRPVLYLTADDVSAANPATADVTTPNSQFASVFSPVANLTTLNLDVRNSVQADLAAMFNYSGENFAFDIGYNFWVRTCDKFSQSNSIAQCCPSLCGGDRNVWALKGDAHVFGFVTGTPGDLAADEPVALSATQCGATIHNGTNVGVTDDDTCIGVNVLQNCGVDNANFAYGSDNNENTRLVHTPGLTATEGNQIKTSLEPKFINCCDINLQRTRGLSHKVFLHLSYTWDKNDYTPYLGFGGFAEFGKTSKCPCDVTTTPDCTEACDDTCCDTQCCTSCVDCSLSQWGVWLKGGVNFQ